VCKTSWITLRAFVNKDGHGPLFGPGSDLTYICPTHDPTRPDPIRGWTRSVSISASLKTSRRDKIVLVLVLVLKKFCSHHWHQFCLSIYLSVCVRVFVCLCVYRIIRARQRYRWGHQLDCRSMLIRQICATI